MQTRLDLYDNTWYKPGSNALGRLLWYFTNVLIFNHGLFPSSRIKVIILRLFGARVGKGVTIKPTVNIKYPWRLQVGDYVWIGENVWIDNLGDVVIGAHSCISQGALLLCGNHHMKKPGFDLVVLPITLETGAWVGAKAVVCPGVTFQSHAVLTAGSVATHSLDAWTVYQGNPAQKIRLRTMKEKSQNG